MYLISAEVMSFIILLLLASPVQRLFSSTRTTPMTYIYFMGAVEPTALPGHPAMNSLDHLVLDITSLHVPAPSSPAALPSRQEPRREGSFGPQRQRTSKVTQLRFPCHQPSFKFHRAQLAMPGIISSVEYRHNLESAEREFQYPDHLRHSNLKTIF